MSAREKNMRQTQILSVDTLQTDVSQSDSIQRPFTSAKAVLYTSMFPGGSAQPFHIYKITFRTPPAF